MVIFHSYVNVYQRVMDDVNIMDIIAGNDIHNMFMCI